MVRRTTRTSVRSVAASKQAESPKNPKHPKKRRTSSTSSDSSEENVLNKSNNVGNNAKGSSVDQQCDEMSGNLHVENELVKENDETSNQDMKKEDHEVTGKGKSKSKNKTDLENSSLLNENEQQTNCQISETVQVTAQSPSNDNPVDNENGNAIDSDATTNVQSIYDNVQTINEDGMSEQHNKPVDCDQSSGEIVECEQNSYNTDNARGQNDDNEPTSPRTPKVDTEINSNNSSESSHTRESKKIRLRRNTLLNTESSKVVQSFERSSSQVEVKTLEKQVTVTGGNSEGEKQPIKKAPVKIKLKRNNYSTSNTEEQPSQENKEIENGIENESKRKIRDWSNVKPKAPFCKVDLETIKNICDKIEVLEEKDVKFDLPRERQKSSGESDKKMERKVLLQYGEESERPNFKKQLSNSSSDEAKEENKNIIAFNRKISIVDDTASKLRPPPDPAKNPVSEILFITNLVRPFTIKQLKELLERTGKIKEDGFWTDRIKSKCYVHYDTKEEAEATRNALHGVNWPVGNGKQLMIEYATVDEMERAQNPPLPATPPIMDLKIETRILPEKENKDPVKKRRASHEEPSDASHDKTRRRSDTRVREWDIGKVDTNRRRSRSRSKNRNRSRERDRSRNRGRSKDRVRSRERDRDKSHKHKRTPSPIHDYVARKQRKAEEEVPQKLMDDLFLKTKATPSIYWQPLSPEEIATKQQQRLIRMEEHKRRMEVSSRNRGSVRESGRGVSYRRR